jgi:hypothetical protein
MKIFTNKKIIYRIKIIMDFFNIKITPVHIDIKLINNEINKNYKSFNEFCYLIYLSLDDEMNARVSQIYHYLYSFKNTNKDFLFEKVKNHQNWIYIQMLKNFDDIKFINDNINIFGIESFNKITNDIKNKFKDKNLNKRSKMLSFIDSDEFYSGWKFYFNKKSEQHIRKIEYLISEVIEDLNGNRQFNEWYRSSLNDPFL